MSAGQPERGPLPGAADGPEPDDPDAADGAIDDYSARVLDLVDAIPPGQVMSYGDIAEYLGEGGPRQVGRVMSRYGGGAPWWRVIHSDGTPPPGHDAQVLRHYMAERTPLRSAARPVRVDMREARWPGPAEPEPARRGRTGQSLAERRLAPPARRTGPKRPGDLSPAPSRPPVSRPPGNGPPESGRRNRAAGVGPPESGRRRNRAVGPNGPRNVGPAWWNRS